MSYPMAGRPARSSATAAAAIFRIMTQDEQRERKTSTEGQSKHRPAKAGELKLGSSVRVKWSADKEVAPEDKGYRGKFFPATITRKREDGTYDVVYEDGDTEERVLLRHIQKLETESELSVQVVHAHPTPGADVTPFLAAPLPLKPAFTAACRCIATSCGFTVRSRCRST